LEDVTFIAVLLIRGRRQREVALVRGGETATNLFAVLRNDGLLIDVLASASKTAGFTLDDEAK